MALPFFYIESIENGAKILSLNEDTSKHIAQVLRMDIGERLRLTDGKGSLLTVELTDNHKRKCVVKVLETVFQPAPEKNISIAISLVKNNSRFEWFLEKATEIGIRHIIPVICTRTEKQHFRFDRMNGILISAMLQSQQSWLPVLSEPIKFTSVVTTATQEQKFIAHCEPTSRHELTDQLSNKKSSKLILIGPEGDFTTEEIASALDNHFMPVALGQTRLRTETAGIVAATVLQLF